MLSPYVGITDSYAELVCEITNVLGAHRPQSTQDIVIRDLLADVFDALHEARRIILTGKCHTAYPLARRAFESLSLLVLCVLNPSVAARWHSGGKISNGEVRRELAKHPFGETQESTKAVYDFFCLGTHPNRALVPGRWLGDGNPFTLGSIGVPNLALVARFCMIHLRMWFWFTAVVLHHHRELVDEARPDVGNRYLGVARSAQDVQLELDHNWKRLLRDEELRHNPSPSV